tara:strand:+ start:66 stop:1160 length:1095 start_codon:yes stop_codon:yes gene_type:complete
MNIDSRNHLKWMKRAIDLALLGKGRTSPNPLVGAVILDKNGELISEGFHLKAGLPHAEAMAFDNLRKSPQGGSIYVNLEPCCHKGKTPPCVKRIISSGIKRVFVSIKDPDSRVSGKGLNQLKEAGIEVNLGLCEKEAISINKSFIHRNLTGQSYGVLKWAMSMDGRIALKNGKSKWITNNYSRSVVHSLRADFDAIIVGGNTLRNDNPLLTTRGKKSPEPLRVVFTKTLNLPRERNLWNCKTAKTLIVYVESSANEKYLDNLPKCVEIAKISSDNPRNLSKLLAERGLNKILWECGPNLATAAFKNGCIQETITFIAPKIMGGVSSMAPFADFDFEDMNEVNLLKKGEINTLEDDFCIRHSFQD